jgi:tape measure domain-containing protein
MTAIASYYARVALQIDKGQLKKVDNFLLSVEKRLRDFQKRASKANGALSINFKFNTARLQADVQRSFIEVGRRVRFPIDNFTINKQNLASQITGAIRQAVGAANKSITLTPKVGKLPSGAGTGSSTGATRSAASLSRANFLHAGGGAGAIARYGFGAMPFIGGAYGVTQLNRANQESISARLTTQAVMQSKGFTEQQGVEAFDWLKNLGNDVGFNYMQAAPDYNQFLSNALGAGMEVGGAQDIFQGFSEFQTAMGVTPARRKLVQNALSQMLGKGVISMEELRRQMAESMPGTIDVFAEALSDMTGSGLTGQKSIAALYESVESGGLESAKILPIVAEILKARAAPKIGVLKKSSIAEQARAENVLADLTNLFSRSGGEQGFAKFFRIMADGLKANEPLVRGLTGAFSDLMTFMEAPLQLVKDFNAGLAEMTSMIGISESALIKLGGLGVMLATKWGRIGLMFATIAAVLQDISRGIQGKNSYTKDIVDWVGGNSTSREDRKSNPNDPLGRKGPLADLWQGTVRPSVNQFSDSFSESMERSSTIRDPNSIYYNDPKGYDDFSRQKKLAAMQDSQSMTRNDTRVTFGDINVQMPAEAVAAGDGERAQMFANMLQNAINETMQNFNLTQ